MSQALTRRMLLKTAAVGAAAAFSHRTAAQASPRVVVVGGGFGGTTCARELKRLAVTLVEASAVYTACPFSNAVLAGLRSIEAQQFKLDAVEKGGINIVRQRAVRIDSQTRRVVLEDGSLLDYDRLVLSP
jgi:sulfide dehydrogenase [flavocytochrome c] flavoprotein chain